MIEVPELRTNKVDIFQYFVTPRQLSDYKCKKLNGVKIVVLTSLLLS